MKVVIIYFSQTGNTQKIANRVSMEMERAGNQVICQDIRDIDIAEICNCDLLGIGSPTFESHIPEPVNIFLDKLPEIRNKRSFIFATCGGALGNVILDINLKLKRKGALVVGSFLSLGQIYHPAPSIRGISRNRPNKSDLNSAGEFAKKVLQVKDRSIKKIHFGIKPRRGFYNIVGKIAESKRLIQFLEPKPELDRTKCKKCELCIKECPIKNIECNVFPNLLKNCIRCYRCLNICPSNAYTVDWKFGDKAISILWGKKFMSYFGEYQRE